MKEPDYIQMIKNKLVLNDQDVKALAEYERQKYIGRVERVK